MKTTARILMTLALAALLAGEALAAAPAGQVNVNNATVQELQLLPRVGPALAQRIVDFRTANGPFKAPEELARVKGISEKSLALLKPYISLEGATTLKEKVKVPRAPKAAAAKS
ncbi:MAG TPA: helix-hairpin-helix domain-containing protein [Thermoanaerobaculaceae bacterium]|nr:helix-hairpin-helix domain-containing protein [Thermoanaerobaculaceae bacterium]HRS17311.1 helix-hairpin-helix domain-containing protein [Thermoanaerobaculaceae bacterium]